MYTFVYRNHTPSYMTNHHEKFYRQTLRNDPTNYSQSAVEEDVQGMFAMIT